MSGKLTRPTEAQKAAMVADYDSGMSCAQVAEKHGVASSSVNRYVRRAQGLPLNQARSEEQTGLTGGRWVQDGLVQRWVEDDVA